MKKKNFLPVLAALLIVSILTGCGGKTGDGAETATTPEDKAVKGNQELTVGSMAEDGYALFVPADTFAEGSEVKLEPVADNELEKYQDSERYEIIGTPVHVTSDSYEGGLFGTDVTLSLPMPEDPGELEGGLGQLVVLYFNDSGEVEYLLPDSYNSADGTMTVCLPHLSPFGSAKLTEKEQINMFLDKYAAQAAVAKADSQRSAADLEPYVKEKIKALGLSEEAGKELTYSVINYIGGQCGEDAGMYTDLATTAYKSIDKKDASDFEAKMEEIISGKLYDMINYNVATGKADSKFKDAGKLGTILGAIAGGDTETAMKEIGDAIGNAVPEIGLATKAAGYVGAKVNETFTNWKSNQIEDLYQKYKNGYEDMWGNEVIVGDEESLKTYLYTSSGFSWSKGVYRFYNMDKTAEVCEKYGWGKKTYEELDEHYRAEFDRRAEEGLLNYFRTRKAQEAEEEKIKEQERECVEEMMRSYGCLSSGNYNKFFGEQSNDDYNLTERLDRIMRVRSMISEYVDEEALAKSQKDGIYNWGVLLNDWVSLSVENKKDDTVKLFIAKLKSYGVLNPAYDYGVAIEDLAGSYSGTVTFKAVRVTEEMYQLYKEQSQGGDASAYGLNIEINSKADCDTALEQFIEEGAIVPSQDLTIKITGEDSCMISGTIANDDGDTFPMTVPAVLKDGNLILTTEEGTTQIKVTEDSGFITLSSDKAVFLMEVEEDGMKESFLIEVSIDHMIKM